MKAKEFIEVLMKKKKFFLIKVTIPLLITMLLFYLLFRRINFFSVLDSFKSANKVYLLIGISLSLLLPLVMARRWQVILRQMKCKISFSESFSIIMGVWPINAILPSKSGDLVKAYFLKDKLRASKTTGTILSERLLDLIMLASFSFIGLILFAQYYLLIIPLIIICGSLFFFILSRFNIRLPIGEKWNQRINNIFLSLKTIRRNRYSFFKVIILTFISWYISMLQVKLFFLAFGVSVPILFIFGNIPISIFVGLIPITIAGMGTRDSAMIILFSLYAETATMLSIGLLYSLAAYWFLAIVGIPFTYHVIKKTRI